MKLQKKSRARDGDYTMVPGAGYTVRATLTVFFQPADPVARSQELGGTFTCTNEYGMPEHVRVSKYATAMRMIVGIGRRIRQKLREFQSD